jgi:excisionase family DNA binding protein
MIATAHATVTPTEADMKLAREGSRTLSPFFSDGEKTVIRVTDSKKSAEVVLPANVFKLLIGVLAELGRGNSVTVMPLEAELTTQQAADLLNVSRPYLITLLVEGQIPYRKVGTRRRVKLIDIISYKNRIDEARMKVLEELTAEAQELNMGY